MRKVQGQEAVSLKLHSLGSDDVSDLFDDLHEHEDRLVIVIKPGTSIIPVEGDVLIQRVNREKVQSVLRSGQLDDAWSEIPDTPKTPGGGRVRDRF